MERTTKCRNDITKPLRCCGCTARLNANISAFHRNGVFMCSIRFSQYKAILIIKPTRSTNFSNLFLELDSTCFGQYLCPLSGGKHCTHSNRYRSYRSCWLLASGIRLEHPDPASKQSAWPIPVAVCTVLDSWWWTEIRSGTCRVVFQK